MNFGQALEALKNGKLVQRTGWNGKGMFLWLVKASDWKCEVDDDLVRHFYATHDDVGYAPWIGMKTNKDKLVPWLASQTDMLAEDWEIFEG